MKQNHSGKFPMPLCLADLIHQYARSSIHSNERKPTQNDIVSVQLKENAYESEITFEQTFWYPKKN